MNYFYDITEATDVAIDVADIEARFDVFLSILQVSSCDLDREFLISSSADYTRSTASANLHTAHEASGQDPSSISCSGTRTHLLVSLPRETLREPYGGGAHRYEN